MDWVFKILSRGWRVISELDTAFSLTILFVNSALPMIGSMWATAVGLPGPIALAIFFVILAALLVSTVILLGLLKTYPQRKASPLQLYRRGTRIVERMYGEKHCYQFLLKNDSSSKTAREISVNIDVFDLSGNAFTAAPVLVNLDGEHSKKINLHPGTEVLFTLIEFEKNSMGLCTLQLNSGDDKKSNGFLPIDEISEYRIALKATAENMPPVFCEHYIECSNEKRVKWQ